MAYKGKYIPKHPEKYQGDPSHIVYRSLWERQCMAFFDNRPEVIKWASEEFSIPYRSPRDNCIHRYFPDFIVAIRKPDGTVTTTVVEVKPAAQTRPPLPTPTGRQTRRYLSEAIRWGINQAKWAATKELCAKAGWEFALFTEENTPFV